MRWWQRFRSWSLRRRLAREQRWETVEEYMARIERVLSTPEFQAKARAVAPVRTFRPRQGNKDEL